MKRNYAICLLLLLWLPAATMAQKRTVAKKKNTTAIKKPVVEEPEEDPRIAEMLEVTQQVVFIDSIVVNKTDFLQAYHLNPETGNLKSYNDFFGTTDGPYNTVYLNELGNKCYFSRSGRLYTSDLLGTEWSEPTLLEGFGNFDRLNYPFMMTDGTTFYFAAMGEQSLGGLDIYRTRFNSENGRFLKAENIGMPFNSEANDYMYAIDETDSIGYFATDRRQPEGKVCIYIFIPTESRRTYDMDDLGEQRVRSLARIDRIRDTWGNGRNQRQALARLKALRTQANSQNQGKASPHDIRFVVDDNVTYSSPSEFLADENRERFETLQKQQTELAELSARLQKARNAYAVASSQERQELSADILSSERQYESLEESIRELEKSIRNAEIKARSNTE